MQLKKNTPQKKKTAAPNTRSPNAQRTAPRPASGDRVQQVPRQGTNAQPRQQSQSAQNKRNAQPNVRQRQLSAAKKPKQAQPAKPIANGQAQQSAKSAEMRITPGSTAVQRPARPVPKAAPKPAKAPKPKKERAEKIKPIKKKKNKDPNRIRVLSVEGRVDIPMLIITLVLLAFGITMMFSASHAYSYRDNQGDSYAYVTRQMTAAVIGLAGMTLITLFDYRFLRFESKKLHITAALIFLIITIGMNALCPIIGIEAQGGQKRWLKLPVFGQFQPSDFLKVALVIFMAYYIHKNSDKMRTFYGGIVKPVLIMMPVAISVIVQKHLSCLLIVFMIFAVMMFVGGVNMKEAVPIALVVVLAVYLAVSVAKVGYFQERIEFMDPLSEPGDRSYQNYQSALAIGSGGIWGKGFGNSSQKYYYLPEAQNDFVFAILVEEFGLVGGVFVILLFIIFVMRGLYIARRSEDKFGCLMATGITFQIGMQALLNIAVNLCCIPNTGVSLPFFSYGGTALVLQLWEIGLLLSISKRAKVN